VFNPAMSNELVSLRDARERAIALLSDRFAHDRLELDEFDRRLTLAHRAGSLAEIDALTTDLTLPDDADANATAALVPAPATTAIVPAASARAEQSLTAVFGGVVRQGQWTAPRLLKVTTVCGGAMLDFREARLPEGVTEVKVFALMGGVQIIVPPGLSVEIGGTAVMGGFDHLERSPPTPDPGRPVLRVEGFAMMGGVSVETRLPGEDERGAHRRRRRERKALRGAGHEGRRALPEPER
jgi:hypothetical protein